MAQNKLQMFGSADQNTFCIYWFLIKAQIHVTNQIHRAALQAQLFSKRPKITKWSPNIQFRSPEKRDTT